MFAYNNIYLSMFTIPSAPVNPMLPAQYLPYKDKQYNACTIQFVDITNTNTMANITATNAAISCSNEL